jgi:hypothetical protein
VKKKKKKKKKKNGFLLVAIDYIWRVQQQQTLLGYWHIFFYNTTLTMAMSFFFPLWWLPCLHHFSPLVSSAVSLLVLIVEFLLFVTTCSMILTQA